MTFVQNQTDADHRGRQRLPGGVRGAARLWPRVAGRLLALLLGSASAGAVEPDWGVYDELLRQYVRPATLHGVAINAVDYAGLAADPRLAAAVHAVEWFSTTDLENRAERIAFLVNAYNLFTLRLVVEHLPVDSIKDIGGLFRPVWKKTAGHIDGRAVSLDEIEHQRLRKLGESRIHMAIVCASVSCPDLRREAYTAAQLDAQLDDQVRRFLANPDKGARREAGVLRVSRIFDWFEDDFDADGGVARFVRRYREVPTAIGIDADLDYDWRLNRLPPVR